MPFETNFLKWEQGKDIFFR